MTVPYNEDEDEPQRRVTADSSKEASPELSAMKGSKPPDVERSFRSNRHDK